MQIAPAAMAFLLLVTSSLVSAEGIAPTPQVSYPVRIELRGSATERYYDAFPNTQVRFPTSARTGRPIQMDARVMSKRGDTFVVEGYYFAARDTADETLITVTLTCDQEAFKEQPPFTDEEAKRKRLPASFAELLRRNRAQPILRSDDAIEVTVRSWQNPSTIQ